MMPSYARDTEVTVQKSKADIENELKRFGCDRLATFEEPGRAGIMFQRNGLRFRIVLTMTTIDQHKRTKSGTTMSAIQQKQAWEKETRRRWRALFLVIKAKLVAVEEEITTLEDEFLSWAVLPSGETVGEMVVPQIQDVARTGQLPPMVPGLPPAPNVIAIGEGRRA